MFNLCKMNCYRMARSKSTWVILISAMCFAAFSIFMGMIDLESLAEEEHPEEISKLESMIDNSDVKFGINVRPPVAEDGGTPSLMEFVAADEQSGVLLLFLTVFVALFIHSEYSSGFVKNISRQKRHPSMTAVSAFSVIPVYSVLLMLGYALVQMILAKMLYPDAALGLTGGAVGYMAVQFVLMCAFGSGVAFVTLAVRNCAFGIVAGMLTACGMGYLFSGLVNLLLRALKFDLNRFLVIGSINSLTLKSGTGELLSCAAVGLAWIVVWILLSGMVTEKRDVV